MRIWTRNPGLRQSALKVFEAMGKREKKNCQFKTEPQKIENTE